MNLFPISIPRLVYQVFTELFLVSFYFVFLTYTFALMALFEV